MRRSASTLPALSALLALVILTPISTRAKVFAFLVSPPIPRQKSSAWTTAAAAAPFSRSSSSNSCSSAPTALRQQLSISPTALKQQLTVSLEADLTDEKVTALYAWVSRAFAGDERYSNLMLALAAVFGNLPPETEPVRLLDEAMKRLPGEEEAVGSPYSLQEREYASLGAMGAAQWTGQFRTRPHALLDVSDLNDVAEWVKELPRGCRRTLKKADGQNFTVTALPIRGDRPAPHSTLAHFRCVVEHEVRLLGGQSPDYFFDALGEAISRYMGTTRMAGEIREYRDDDTGRVIAFAHEVTKGRTIRGQWFYATDRASKSYVWFHSVQDLVRRAIDTKGVDVVDLGPSGSDAFSELKERYRFVSVDDWPAVADYLGPFVHADGKDGGPSDLGLIESLKRMIKD